MGVLMRAIAASIQRHSFRLRESAISVLAVAVFVLGASPASARKVGGEHVYDPALSLTGSGELVSKIDPIPDPGTEHPAEPFIALTDETVDSKGYVYVINETKFPSYEDHSSRSYIDVFDPAGHFIASIENDYEPERIAVDNNGVIYVSQNPSYGPQEARKFVRYEPSAYPPVVGMSYSAPITAAQSSSYG